MIATMIQLFIRFFQVGLFAIGGGMATIPFLYDMSDVTGWFTYTDLANMIAVSESTPGPIGINMATYVGFLTGSKWGGAAAGVTGAVCATLGIITPSIVIILIIARVLKRFRDNRYVSSAFYGLRPASTGLIAAAGLSVAMSNLFFQTGAAQLLSRINWKGWLLAALLWLLTNRVKKTKDLHPIVFIGISALAGILFAME